MVIKLSNFIKDTNNVFTKEEAEMIYLAAGYIDSENEYQVSSAQKEISQLVEELKNRVVEVEPWATEFFGGEEE